MSILLVRAGSVATQSQIDVPKSDARTPSQIAARLSRFLADNMTLFEELVGAKVVPGQMQVTFEMAESSGGASGSSSGGGGGGGGGNGGGGGGKAQPPGGPDPFEDGALSVALVVGVSVAAGCVCLVCVGALAFFARTERARAKVRRDDEQRQQRSAGRARARSRSRSRSRSPADGRDVTITVRGAHAPPPREGASTQAEGSRRGRLAAAFTAFKPRRPSVATSTRGGAGQ
ncbi:hypothetical protein KFE25_013114 [Diacronema lutheri]|uniref:Uncharacterized protein n=1 Tax=Diacronema lutheri TaxID=2081491 RepID=A0A8J6C4S3_DIALT|nr:hypothetical protein KFE25_013114 [Diacronema lutheri]